MHLSLRLTLAHCLICALAPAASAQMLRTVALSDVRPSELPSGIPFERLGIPVMNNTGQVAFTGSNSFQRTNSIWLEESGGLRLVAYEGQQVPGAADGVTWGGHVRSPNLHLNAAGQLLFSLSLPGSGVTFPFRPFGLWLYESGAIREIARGGMVPPGVPDGHGLVSINFFLETGLNSRGEVVFVDTLSDGLEQFSAAGLWVDKLGALTPIAVTGDQAPGLPDGVTFDQFVLGRHPALDEAGRVAFASTLSGAGVDNTNNSGVWYGDSESLLLVARSGEQAAGLPEGALFTGFTTPVRNSDGRITFQAGLSGSGVDAANDEGYWSVESGSAIPILREGDQVPFMPEGVVLHDDEIGSYAHDLSMNSAGELAFIARMSGPGIDETNDVAILAGDPGRERMVARKGQHAPGTPEGVNFGEPLSGFSGLEFLTLNSAGQTAFRGHLVGPGVSNSNGEGIWAEDRSGELRLIARSGDLLEVAPGDSRTISFLLFVNDVSGEGGGIVGGTRGFNDRGQIAFWARFSDGTEGVFVSNLVAVPEPSGAALCLLTLLSARWRLRR